MGAVQAAARLWALVVVSGPAGLVGQSPKSYETPGAAPEVALDRAGLEDHLALFAVQVLRARQDGS